MDPRLVCEIFVRDNTGTIVSRGTGYPITRDRVWTAQHVVAPSGAPGYSITVCFEFDVLDDEKVTTRSHALPATLVPCGATAEKFDTAILALELPEDLQPGHLLLHDPPLVDTLVRGQGFPKLKKKNAKGRKDAFDGTLRTFTKSESSVPFRVENSPVDHSAWAGASGSAVFDNNEPSHMFGVVTDRGEGKVQSELYIVPLPALLQLDEFRQAIRYAQEYEPRAKHRDIVIRHVTDCLDQWRTGDAKCFLAFEETLKELAKTQDRDLATFNVAEFIVDQCPVDVLMDSMVAFAHPEARPQLKKLSKFVVPLNYAIDRVEELRRFSTQGKPCLLENAVVEKSLSEVIMSGFDAQPGDLNSGAMIDVEPPPTEGLSPVANEQERRVRAFFQDLFALFGVKNQELFGRTLVHVDELLKGEAGRMLYARLRTRKKGLGGRTAFCVVVMDQHSQVQTIQRSVFATVSKLVNHQETLLAFIECRDRSDDSADAQRSLLANFEYLLNFED